MDLRCPIHTLLSSKVLPDVGFKPSWEEEKKDAEDLGNASGNPTKRKDSEVLGTEEPRINQEKDANINNTNNINNVSPTVNAASIEDNVVDENISYRMNKKDERVVIGLSPSVDEVTLAQALAALKSAKPKADKIKVQNKGKGIMIEEPLKMKKKDQISFDEQEAIRLQAKFDEEERLAREKDEVDVALTEEWNDIQAKIDVDYHLAQRLQAREQEELTDEEKARLFIQFLEQRRKYFAAKRAEEKRKRPPIIAQQRSIMCTYLKNIERWKPKSLKSKSFANIQELFDKAFKRVNTFVDYRTELVEESSKKAKVMEESSKKAESEIAQESSSKRAGNSNDRDDVTIDATPLSTKSPTIVDYKIYKEGKKSFFQIIRADGNSQMYLTFRKMLKNFNREDLEVLWSIVKARFKKTEPVNYMDNFLLLNLKTMFEHHVEDSVWKNQQGLVKVLNWKLYDSYGVHYFNDVKLQVDYECKMAFELLRLVKKQLKEGYGRIVGIKSLLEVTAAKVCVTAAK
ncbi:hypothetical protein Tco_0277787 [Tanacetum coccineum]